MIIAPRFYCVITSVCKTHVPDKVGQWGNLLKREAILSNVLFGRFRD